MTTLKAVGSVEWRMDAVDLAAELAEVPSHEDPTAVGDRIETWLSERTAAAVERDAAGNVIARRNRSAEPTLALVGHHDVVAPGDRQTTEEGGYRIERQKGRLYGRGTADMKGSLAAAMVAFEAADPDCELVFASFVGEETGGVGCRAAIEAGFAPDYAVVVEGSTGYSASGVTDVAVAHRGRRGVTIEAAGESAHASEPNAGENAIYYAHDAISELRAMTTPTTTVLDREISGSVTVTEIEGGNGHNVVPADCRVTVDERTVPGGRAPLSDLESLSGIAVTVDSDVPPMACEEETFADTVLEAARAVQENNEESKGVPQAVIKPHATDAGWLTAHADTTCVVCGAAEPGEAHTATESVAVETIRRCASIYRRAAESVS